MENIEKFKESLDKAVEIRTFIQDEVRQSYNWYKRLWKRLTEDDSKIFKHLVDMYHYRYGGYPNPTSAPKHTELLDKFAWFVLYFKLFGWKKSFIDEYLADYGIKVIIIEGKEIKDEPIPLEVLEMLYKMYDEEVLASILGPTLTTKAVFKRMLLSCDKLQDSICANANEIRRELAPEIEEECGIKKGDFNGSVTWFYRDKKRKLKKKHAKKALEAAGSKMETTQYNIENSDIDDDDDEAFENE